MLPTGRSRREMGAGLRGLALVLCGLFSTSGHALVNNHVDNTCASGAVAKFTTTAGQNQNPGGCPAMGNAPPAVPGSTTLRTLAEIEASLEVGGADGSVKTFSTGHTCTFQDSATVSGSSIVRRCLASGPGPQCGSGTPSVTWETFIGIGAKVCSTATSCPSAGTLVEGGIKSYTGTSATENVSHKYGDKYCNVSGVGVCVGIPGGTNKSVACSGGWAYTGAEASSPAFQQVTSNSVCGADGKTCVANSPDSQCGTFNGEYVCLNSIPGPGSCTLTPKGSPVCTSTPAAPLTTPPAPASTSNPSIPATPAAQYTSSATGGSGGTVVNVYNPGGSGPAGGDGTNTGDSAGEEPGEIPDPCGAPGQPVCDVKIDETGVPADVSALDSAISAAQTEADSEEAASRGEVDAQLANEPLSSWSPFSGRPVIPTGPCQTMTVGFFGGSTGEFPSPELCEAIDDKFKPLIAFFLYLITGVSITLAVIRARAGQT